MASPKYRLSGSEMPELAEYKYPDPNCTDWFLLFYSFL
jgi:hypothetical protein